MRRFILTAALASIAWSVLMLWTCRAIAILVA